MAGEDYVQREASGVRRVTDIGWQTATATATTMKMTTADDVRWATRLSLLI